MNTHYSKYNFYQIASSKTEIRAKVPFVRGQRALDTGVVMKSQDILLMLKIASLCRRHHDNLTWEKEIIYDIEYREALGITDVMREHRFKSAFSTRGLAEELGVSKTEIAASMQRLNKLNLIQSHDSNPKITTNKKVLLELIQYAVPYFFPAEISGISRGTPTGFAAPILIGKIMSAGEFAYVWADDQGKTKGLQLSPLYPSVPIAIRGDDVLYNYLALVDAIRIGNPREKAFSIDLLKEIL